MSFRGDKGHVEDRIHALPCWSGPVEIEPLGGGLTNLNFRVTDGGKAYVARTTADIPELFVYRWHEALACDAAHMAGIAPAVIFRGDGIMITDFVAGRTLSEVDIRSPRYIERIAPLLKRAHTRMPDHWRGAMLSIWPFRICRTFATLLAERRCRYGHRWPAFLDACASLERLVGPADHAVTHNDLLASNFIDDGERLWLIDWEYAGASLALFDLANLAINSDLTADHMELLIDCYGGLRKGDDLMRRLTALKAASALREAGWSMMQEVISPLDMNYETYTDDAIRRFTDACREIGIDP